MPEERQWWESPAGTDPWGGVDVPGWLKSLWGYLQTPRLPERYREYTTWLSQNYPSGPRFRETQVDFQKRLAEVEEERARLFPEIVKAEPLTELSPLMQMLVPPEEKARFLPTVGEQARPQYDPFFPYEAEQYFGELMKPKVDKDVALEVKQQKEQKIAYLARIEGVAPEDINSMNFPRYFKNGVLDERQVQAAIDVHESQQERDLEWHQKYVQLDDGRVVERKDLEAAEWRGTIQAEAAGAAQGVTIPSFLQGTINEAQSIGLDVSWVQPKMQEIAYNARMGRVTGIQGQDPQMAVFEELRGEIARTKQAEEIFQSQRLAARFPLIAQRYEQTMERERIQAFEGMSSEEQDIMQAGGAEGGRLEEEVAWAGGASLAAFIRGEPGLQQQVFRKDVEMLTEHPQMFPTFMQSREAGTFQDWIGGTPARTAAFEELQRAKTPTSGRVQAPRWATPRARV